MFVSLLRDNDPQFEEMYPPGTHVERIDPATNMVVSGTVMDIPFPVDVSASSNYSTNLPYTILFNNGTTASIPLSQMATLIPPPQIPSAVDDNDSLLPPFLCLNSCIRFEHKGRYHKGYLGQHDAVYCFSFKLHVNKWKEDCGVLLPSLPSTWVDLCVEGIFIPGVEKTSMGTLST